MWSWVGVSREARFVRARRDSKAWSCHVEGEDSVGVSRERRGRMVEWEGKVLEKMWEGFVEMRMRERAWAVWGAAVGG